MVKFPSGLGFVATGMATYRAMENPVATRIAKRKAYVLAYTQANWLSGNPFRPYHSSYKGLHRPSEQGATSWTYVLARRTRAI
jgi:hypothetical protein